MQDDANEAAPPLEPVSLKITLWGQIPFDPAGKTRHFMSSMAFPIREVQGVSILDLDGEIDLHRSPEVRAEIGKLIDRKSKALAVHFGKVSYIDSSGLATIIDAFQKMRGYGGKLGLVALTTPVRSVFEVARLDQFFKIFDEESAAVTALRADAGL